MANFGEMATAAGLNPSVFTDALEVRGLAHNFQIHPALFRTDK